MKKAMVASVLVFAATSAAIAAPAGPDQLGPQLAWTVVEKGTRSTDMNARAEAVKALQFVTDHDVRPFLQDSLADAQWTVRKHAIAGLVRLGDTKARTLLEECLYNPSLPMESDALELVGVLPEKEARAMFGKAIMDSANPARKLLMTNLLDQDVEVMALWFAEGLLTDTDYFTGKLDSVRRDALPDLLTRLAGDKRPGVFMPAVKAAMAREIDIDPSILTPFLKSRDLELRYQAAEALARQNVASAVSVLLPLADGSNEDKVRFLKAASAAPSDAVRDKVWGMMKPDTPPEMLTLIYMCFPATGDTKVLKNLESDIVSTNAARRPAAVRAIGRVKGTRALPQLNDLLIRDGNREVRMAAARAIGDLAQAESVQILGKATNDPDRDVKMAALEALGKIKDRSVIGVVSALTFDSNPKIKTAALKAIAGINHKDAVSVLRVAADDSNPEIRSMALGAMMRMDPQSALGRFERAMLNLGQNKFIEFAACMKDDFAPFAELASTSQHTWAREAVLKSMKFMPKARIKLLQEMAQTSNYEETRIEALEVMAALEPDVAFENASTMLNENTPPLIRAAAFRIIGSSDRDGVHDLLMRGIEDPDEYVQNVAASAILEKSGAKPKKGKARRSSGRRSR